MARRVLLLLLLASSAFAQQPKTINMVARANPWQFVPSSFTVNQGDLVTLNITVDAADASPAGHGFLMSTYFENAVAIPRGQTKQITFTASMAGTFPFVCSESSCGNGHTSMFGQMVVVAAGDPVPAIASVSPATGPTSGGTLVTIIGSGFTSPTTVLFGSVAARNVTVVSPSMITAVAPLGPATEQVAIPVDITVQTPLASAVKRGAFSYFVPPLFIESVTPASGGAGTVVTITGAGFTTAVASSVSFGGIAASGVAVVDAVTMRATVPAHIAGTVDVAVRFGSTTVTKPRAFTYADARRRAVRH
jgi:plastocyanin